MIRYSLAALGCIAAMNASSQTDTVRVDTTWKTVILTTPQANPIVDTVIVEPEEQPRFPGGEEALYRHLSTSLNYPDSALESGIQGTVYVEFIVEKDGRVDHATVKRSVHASLDEEALRVIRAMPKWVPGKKNGEPVRVKYTIPVKFALK